MSLELALQENTAAIRDLIAAIQAGAVPSAAAVVAETKPAKAEKPKAEKPAAEPKPAKVEPEQQAAQEPAAEAATAQEETAAAELTYPQVQQATLDAVKRAGKQPVVDLLAKYGATKATELSQDQWPEYVAAVSALGA